MAEFNVDRFEEIATLIIGLQGDPNIERMTCLPNAFR